MFKALHRIKDDNKGFTITELLVTVAIMALVAGLLCQLMGSIWIKYRMVENLYIIQTEVQAIARAFQTDSQRGSLATATNVDLFYEDPAAVETNKNFQSCSGLGTFTEDEAGNLTFNNKTDNTYNYLFVYKNYFYVLDYDSNIAHRFKYTDEAKINIKYEVSVDAFAKDVNNKEGSASYYGNGHRYLADGITITIESAPEYQFHYALNTSFSLKNAITGGNEVNMNNSADYALTNEHVAGYTHGILPASYNNGTPEGQYPNISDQNGKNYVAESGKTYLDLNKPANLIRYISVEKFNQSTPTGEDGGMSIGTGCGISILMMDNKLGEGVKTTLRGFRDNVLKGNAVGEMIIDKYYNSWSPVIIEISSKSPAAKKVLTDVIIGTAYVIEMAK